MAYFTNVYPESESTILPTVWVETGVEIFGRVLNFNYNLALVNGLDAAGFSSKDGSLLDIKINMNLSKHQILQLYYG